MQIAKCGVPVQRIWRTSCLFLAWLIPPSDLRDDDCARASHKAEHARSILDIDPCRYPLAVSVPFTLHPSAEHPPAGSASFSPGQGSLPIRYGIVYGDRAARQASLRALEWFPNLTNLYPPTSVPLLPGSGGVCVLACGISRRLSACEYSLD